VAVMTESQHNGRGRSDEGAIQTQVEEPGLNIQKYLQLLLKRKWLILSVLVVVLGATAVWTFTRTKIYKATATVLVDQKAPQVLGNTVNDVVDLTAGGWRSKDYIETQRRVVHSLTLARTVAERLALVSNATFWGPNVKPDQRTREGAARTLARLIAATPARDANVLEIAVEHPDAALTARLANTVAQAFMDQNVEYKLTSTNGAVKWLSDQLDDLKKQLEQSELALYEFKKKHNIISISLEDKQSIVARQIEKFTDGLTEIRLRRMALDAQRKQILAARERNPEKDPLKVAIAPVMENTVVQRLKDALVDENRRYLALKEKYDSKWPAVREQKAKVEAARKDLDREVNNVLASLETKYKEVKDNQAQIAAALQSAKDEALNLNKREVDYQRLKRTQENNAKLYGLVLSRMKESDLSAQLRVNNIRLLDAAIEPRAPVRPRVQLSLAIGAVLGFLLGIVLAFLVDTLDNSVKSQEDIDQVQDLVYLGLMPRIPGAIVARDGKRPAPKPEVDLIVHRNPKSTVAESCRSIRTNVLFASAGRSTKTIMVTSPGPREGKTTTAVSMAIVMAQAGARVVIVDTDMRRPRLHRIFGVPGADGITTVLLGSGKLDDEIKATEVPGLSVLPCGPIPPNPAELCQGEQFKGLLAQLAERFDFVLLDSPPVMVVTDAVVLGTQVDGTLLVARTGQTTRGGLLESVRQVRDVGSTILGCVLNDMDLEKRGYGYYRYRRYGYYRYGYSRYGYGHYGEKEEVV
jgi:capsular exopolysaccharide synthesis family protein